MFPIKYKMATKQPKFDPYLSHPLIFYSKPF